MTDADVYAEVTEHIRLRGPGRLAARRGHGERPQVLSVHVCEPGAGVAEAAVRIREGDRSRAVALRLEAAGGRWLCTHLQLG